MHFIVSKGNGDFLIRLDDKSINFTFRGFIPKSCKQFTAILLLCDEIRKRANLDKYDRPRIQVQREKVYVLWNMPLPQGGMATERQLLFKEDPIKPLIGKFKVGYVRSLAEYYYNDYKLSSIPTSILVNDIGAGVAVGAIPYEMKL